MRIPFTKMHGAGNDFVVLDATRAPLDLSPVQLRFLADRHRGVGADQILIVGPAPSAEVDFSYRIVNADGGEVEHCGNGARCFVRFVREQGLTQKTSIRVQTQTRVLTLTEQASGGVTVDMGVPSFGAAAVGFASSGSAAPQAHASYDLAQDVVFNEKTAKIAVKPAQAAPFLIALCSMGNPHAVHRVDGGADLWALDVPAWGRAVQECGRFAQGVNVGFLRVLSRSSVELRVFERGAGETLACGTGACAAVAVGVVQGWLGAHVKVRTHGGVLTIDWPGSGNLHMTGPATTVFRAEIDLPDDLT